MWKDFIRPLASPPPWPEVAGLGRLSAVFWKARGRWRHKAVGPVRLVVHAFTFLHIARDATGQGPDLLAGSLPWFATGARSSAASWRHRLRHLLYRGGCAVRSRLARSAFLFELRFRGSRRRDSSRLCGSSLEQRLKLDDSFRGPEIESVLGCDQILLVTAEAGCCCGCQRLKASELMRCHGHPPSGGVAANRTSCSRSRSRSSISPASRHTRCAARIPMAARSLTAGGVSSEETRADKVSTATVVKPVSLSVVRLMSCSRCDATCSLKAVSSRRRLTRALGYPGCLTGFMVGRPTCKGGRDDRCSSRSVDPAHNRSPSPDDARAEGFPAAGYRLDHGDS